MKCKRKVKKFHADLALGQDVFYVFYQDVDNILAFLMILITIYEKVAVV
jgi:hypothetical protein